MESFNLPYIETGAKSSMVCLGKGNYYLPRPLTSSHDIEPPLFQHRRRNHRGDVVEQSRIIVNRCSEVTLNAIFKPLGLRAWNPIPLNQKISTFVNFNACRQQFWATRSDCSSLSKDSCPRCATRKC